MKTNSFKRLITVYLLVIFGIASTLTSCVQTKQIVYFQGDTLKYQSFKVPVHNQKKIQTSDILGIFVTSLDQESNQVFNIPNINNLTVSNYSSNAGMGRSQPAGYEVDVNGNVLLPLIGKVKLKDLTTEVAADTLTNRLKAYLKDPAVSVRILNHKFSVLGEVNRPSIYNMLEDRVTITEALGMAGDLTIFGKRNNVLLIRESNLGVREMIRIDLTQKDILLSPYYYVQNNDILYVEPLKTKATVTDQNYQLIPIFTGIVSALGILILNLRN